jgi:CheY-like chemotaxis protein
MEPTMGDPILNPAQRVLVVDGDPDTVAVLNRSLSHRGYSVRTASTSRDAQKVCREQRFDVVLSEVFLPDGSGLDLAKQIRGCCPEVRLVAFTVCGTAVDRQEIYNAGFDAHLLKPATINMIVTQLDIHQSTGVHPVSHIITTTEVACGNSVLE